MQISFSVKYAFFNGFKILDSTIFSIGLIGSLGHPLYWLIWTYLFPQFYESALLRFSGAIVCLGFLFAKTFKNYFYIYYFFGIAYILPFIFTVQLIMNKYSDVWLICQAGMFFMVGTFMPNFLLVILNLILGIGFACIYCLLLYPDAVIFSLDYLPYLPVAAFGIIFGFIFSYNNAQGVASEMRANLLRSLAGSIAHEIRNPFNAVAGYNAAIENHLPKLTAKTAEQTYQISEQNFWQIQEALIKSNHAIQLGAKITETILLSLKNETIDTSNFKAHAASQIINYVLEHYGYSESTDKNLIRSNIEDDFILWVDQDILVYVLFNLIKNALYYKNKPGFQIQIITKTDKEQNFIKIKDNGPGIPQNKLEEIFNNFYSEGKKGGTGLGLPFCKRMMEAFKGQITCTSSLGNWTEFTLSFPKANSKALSEIKNSSTPKPPETLLPGLNEMQQALANKCFLIVDDEESNRYAIKMLLQNTNCQLHEAKSGQEALEAVKQHLYDAILSDLNMPELNGDQMVQHIRQNPAYQTNQHTPIFMITGKTGDKDKQAMLESGVTDILSKPINKHTLTSTLYQHLTKETEIEKPVVKQTETILITAKTEQEKIKALSEKSGLNLGHAAEYYDRTLDQIQRELKTLIERSEKLIPVLKQAYAEQDYKAIETHLHRIVYLPQLYNLKILADLIKKLEEEAADRQFSNFSNDLLRLETLIQEVLTAAHIVIEALESI